MILSEIMIELEKLGTEQTKKTLKRHGAREPLFGVKIGDLKKLVKHIKKDQLLALNLYDTDNYDAMYLAGLAIDPKQMTKEQLQNWVAAAYCHTIAECTVANVTAESRYAIELARQWLKSDHEMIVCAGWTTYTNYLSITPDEKINISEVQELLMTIEKTIHTAKNRERYNMNHFVIAVGTYISSMFGDAKLTADRVGKVTVDVGNTACKIPFAPDYLDKIAAMGRVGQKRKTCIC